MKRLKSRETGLALAAIVLLAGWALWGLVVAPLVTARANGLGSIASANAIADLLARAPLAGSALPMSPVLPLRTRLTRRAEAADLQLRRLEPSGTALSVTLDDAAYTDLIGWLDVMTREEGARILSVEIARRPPPGIVSARIMLEPRQ